jgi:hypothetical protein
MGDWQKKSQDFKLSLWIFCKSFLYPYKELVKKVVNTESSTPFPLKNPCDIGRELENKDFFAATPPK